MADLPIQQQQQQQQQQNQGVEQQAGASLQNGHHQSLATASVVEAELPPPSQPVDPPHPAGQTFPIVHVETQDSLTNIDCVQAAASDKKPSPAVNGHIAHAQGSTDQLQQAQQSLGSGEEEYREAESLVTASSGVMPTTASGADVASSTTETASMPQATLSQSAIGNAYDAKEEADVGASAGTAPDPDNVLVTQVDRPSENATDAANKPIPLPLDVNGVTVQGQDESSEGKSQAASLPSAATLSKEERPSPSVHLNGTTSTLASTVDSAPSGDVTVDANASSLSSNVATALSDLGVGVNTQEAPVVSTIDSLEPPAKRQRTETLPGDLSFNTAEAPSSATSTFPDHSPRPVAATPNTTATPGGSLPDASVIAMTPAQIKFAQNSIKSLKGRPESPAFQAPVNPVALGIPHYTQIITQPMDLGTIDIKLALTAAATKGGKPTEKTKQAASWGLDPSKDVYTSVEQWEGEVRLVFANCIRFNGPDHPVSASAKALEAVFERHMKALPVELPAAQPEPIVDDKKARRPSNPVPTIRRLSSDLSGRPKREIHPPPPRDLPYSDEPQSSSGGKKRKSGKPLTIREQQHYAKVNQDELKYCLKVIDDFLTKASNQHFMWVFNDLPAKDMDFGPAYYQMIKRPICLNQIQGKLRRREYANKREFVADMKLLFQNCYTFNPPDNEVHQMGKRTEAVFEERMSNMPKAKPLSPEPDHGDGEEEEDAEAEAAKLAQIRELEEKLAEMKREAKLGGSKATGSISKAGGTKKKASGGAAVEGKKKAVASKAKASSFASGSADGQAKKSKQAKKKATGGSKGGVADSDEEEDVRVVTYEQKEELARKITQLSDERLDGALQIISEDKPANANDDEEIELDIDDLSPRTLYRLYRYVVKPKKKPGPKPGTIKAGSGKGVGGKKRKNLDEEAEAARIAALQQQLNSFERASAVGGGNGVAPSAAAVAAPAAGGHDDLVQSDSSSGEDDSDGSESDY